MSETIGFRRNWRSLIVMASFLTWMLFDTAGFEAALKWMFPEENPVIHQRETMLEMFGDHIAIMAVSSGLAIVIGGLLGVVLLSGFGRHFEDVLANLASFGQAMPSIALIALMVPWIGYGAETVVIALVVYSVLPVMLSVVAGARAVPTPVVDAAVGMGMTGVQRLLWVQLPLAAPIILGGVKNMMIINVSAAAMGAIVGAGGFGVSIFAGIAQFNNALIFAGALPTVVLALMIDRSI